MVSATQISDQISLYDLRVNFGLQRTSDETFFSEWYENLPALTELEQTLLDRVKCNFESLTERSPVSENLVKMAVVSPLLDLAGFYSIDYQILDETSVEIIAEGEDARVYRGRIDILVIKDQLWLAVIESKHSKFSLVNAIPQALAYMLGNPNPEKPVFGLVTNGYEFHFLKVVQQPTNSQQLTKQYGRSKLFSLRNPGNDLYEVVQVLKSIATLVHNDSH